MAVDTRDKRFSAASLMGLEVMPNPDGGFGTAANRQQVGGYYSGIAADAPASIVSGPFDVVAAQVFTAGAVESEVFHAGASKAEVFNAGAVESEVVV